jgi:hypothetical protein
MSALNQTDLFNNPFIDQARKNMNKKDIQNLEKKGKDFFENVDITEDSSEVVNRDVFLQLDSMIRSGLHPSYLTKEEKGFMENYKGKNWFMNYGYLHHDLDRIN